MQKANPSIQKTEVRNRFRALRKNLSRERRIDASTAVLELLARKGRILSFSSIGSEIDLSLLNQRLVEAGRLLLPRIEGDEIVPYSVDDLENGLILSALKILEPKSQVQNSLPQDACDIILLPGLAFDPDQYRLGYGKGHYDRFLKKNKRALTIGVGFIEQFSSTNLPRDPWDIPLDELFLV